MGIVLRDYQQKIITDAAANFKEGIGRQVIVAPTGSGKTIVFSYLVTKAVEHGKKVLILTNRNELMQQAGKAVTRFNVDVGVISGKSNPKRFKESVYVAMGQSLASRLKRFDYYVEYVKSVDLIIIDEAHIAIFDKLFPYFSEDTPVLAFTATPIRKGKQKGLDELYGGMVETLSTQQLIDKGFLCPARSYHVPVDLSRVDLSGGEFDRESMTEFYHEKEKYLGAVNNYKKFCDGEKAILFCSGIKNSIAIRDEFRAAGISAEHIDSENITMAQRKDILKRFEDGEFQILCNIGICTTGFDCPSITTVILYKATLSLALFLQMAGRGSRLYPGKTHYKLLDFGGNLSRFGLWEADRTWSLEKIETKKKKALGAPLVKECGSCEALVSASAKVCSYCGTEFPVKKIKSVEVILEEIETVIKEKSNTPEYFAAIEKRAEIREESHKFVVRQFKTLEDLTAYGEFKEYANPTGWAYGIMSRRNSWKRK